MSEKLVMWASERVRPAAQTWAVLSCLFFLSAGPARADRLPLPAAEQAEVNRAIDQGVVFLKATQLPSGSWAADGNHQAGLAALPGLTLLECGVPADDSHVRRAAAYVRASVPKMDQTYELALSVLFLDRLGDPRDEKLIQVMALRLVAGQSVTGGWGYKCPLLSTPQNRELLLILRQINPRPAAGGPALAGGPANGPALAGGPAANPGPALAGGPAANPGPALAGGPAVPGPNLTGTPALASPSLAGGPAYKSPGEAPPAASAGTPVSLPADSPARAADRLLSARDADPISSHRWAWCIKSEEEPPPDAAPAPEPAKPAAPKPGVPAPVAPRTVVIPAEMRGLAVLQDFAALVLTDPDKRQDEVVAPTTDNSNTQFAILALWVAQRHDVPMDRTLRLIANRFQTSQNADGSWGYRYVFGGGNAEGAPMDCVGLLGLAVGHGLAVNGQPAAGTVRDPKVLSGFAALNKHVGVPAGRTRDLPMVSLYLLWSIERVGVLFDLPTIADKDWYRWGAEVLVANQSDQGAWPEGGGYPGATPPINTSLALLFLRRANLVFDLTTRLPFKPNDLGQSIEDTVAPPKATAPLAAPAADIAKAPPAAPAAPLNALGGYPDQKPPPAVVSSTPVDPVADADLRNRTKEKESGGRGWLVLILVLIGLLLLAAAVVVLAVHFRNRKKESEGTKERKAKRTNGKRPKRPRPEAPAVKKSTRKTGLHA